MSSLNDFRATLRSEHFTFAETLAFIAEHYQYQPSAFSNGNVHNAAGQNEGSCKTLGLALLEGLSLEETLLCFGEQQRPRQYPRTDGHRPGGRALRTAVAAAQQVVITRRNRRAETCAIVGKG